MAKSNKNANKNANKAQQTSTVQSKVVVVNRNVVQSKDQQRAKHALIAIEKLKDELEHSKVKSAVSGLPAMIHMNGLGHAFAFFLSDVNNFPEREAIVKIVFDWLKNDGEVLKDYANISALNAITRIDMATYQIAQQEAQAYLLWLKKFARALLTSND